jgi:tetratricopeptide (TPR) repeat protein
MIETVRAWFRRLTGRRRRPPPKIVRVAETKRRSARRDAVPVDVSITLGWAAQGRVDQEATDAYIAYATHVSSQSEMDPVHALLRQHLCIRENDSGREGRRKWRAKARLAFLNPSLEWPKAALGEEAIALGRMQTAARLIDMVPVERLSAPVLLALARTHISNGNDECAQDLLEKARSAGGDEIEVRFWLELTRSARESPGEFVDSAWSRAGSVSDHVLRGALFLSKADVTTAAVEFDSAASTQPLASLLGRALCAEVARDAHAAAECLGRAEAIGGRSVNWLTAKARLAHRAGENAAAIALFEKALELSPRNDGLRLEWALAALDADASRTAITETLLDLQLRGCRDERLLDALGRVHAESGKLDEALTVWGAITKPSRETIHDMAACRHRIALRALGEGDVTSALQYWKQLPPDFRARPEVVEGRLAARRLQVIAALLAGNPTEARLRVERAYSAVPGDLRFALLWGVTLMATDLSQAVRVLDALDDPLAALLLDVALLLRDAEAADGDSRFERLNDAGSIWQHAAAVLARDFSGINELAVDASKCLFTNESWRYLWARTLYDSGRFAEALEAATELKHPLAGKLVEAAALEVAAAHIEAARIEEACAAIDRALRHAGNGETA